MAQVRGLTIDLGFDTQDFDNSIKGINKGLKNTNSNLNALNKLIRVDPNNIEALTRKQDLLTDKVGESNRKFNMLNDELKEAKRRLDIGEIGRDEFDKIQRQVDRTQASVVQTNKQLEQTNKKIKSIKTEKLKKLSNGFKSVGSTLSRTVTPAILGAIGAAAALTNKFIETGDEIAKTANKLQITSEELQEWRFLAERSGVANASLEKSFVKVNAAIADVATEAGGPAAEALEELGVTQKLLEDLNLSSGEAYDLVIKKLSLMEDTVKRTALANEIFGDKIATELNPILNTSRFEIDALREEARKLGIVTNEDAAEAERLADQITNLKQEFGKLAMDLAVDLLPLFEDLVAFVKDELIPKIKEATSWFGNLNDKQKKLVVVLGLVAAAAGPVLSLISSLIVILPALAAGIGSVTIAGAPLWAILLAIIAAISALIFIWQKWGDEIIKFVKFNLEFAKMKFEQFGNKIKDIFQKVKDFLQPIKDFIDGLVDKIGDVVSGAKKLGAKVGDAFQNASTVIDPAFAATSVQGFGAATAGPNVTATFNITESVSPALTAEAVNDMLGGLGT